MNICQNCCLLMNIKNRANISLELLYLIIFSEPIKVKMTDLDTAQILKIKVTEVIDPGHFAAQIGPGQYAVLFRTHSAKHY